MRKSDIMALGYNSLANAEVVVDREKMVELLKCWAKEDKKPWVGVYNCANVIATAIESGSIISLKEE